MNVLSLFDGISCGQIALERAGIKVANYYASEIDKHAIKVAKKNYPNTIHLGDVRTVKAKDLPQIDLLIGGSPCQGFSFAGKQLNFEDPRSALFFEFVRLLNECNPKYFLLENVKMKKGFQEAISNLLGVEPIEINSALVSAQNRRRLYWTNIQGIKQPKDKGIILADIIQQKQPINKRLNKINQIGGIYRGEVTSGGTYGQGNRIYSTNGKGPTINAQSGGKAGNGNFLITKDELKNYRKLTPIECERLQTVPDNYTEGVSNTQRYKMLGNGWTVDVIAHIFSNIA